MSLSYFFGSLSGTHGCLDGFTFAGDGSFSFVLNISLTYNCLSGLAFSVNESESIKAIIKGISQQCERFCDASEL